MSHPGDPRELAPTGQLPGWGPPASWSVSAVPLAAEPTRVGPTALLMLAVGAAVAALGVPFGLLWAALAPDVPLLVTDDGVVYADAQPEQLAAADGWFTILAVPFGVLLAIGVWLVARHARGLPALVALTIGAVGAGLIAWWLGRQLGLAGFQATLAAAEAGADLTHPPDLRVADVGWWPPRLQGVPLVPALTAAASYTLMAAWSRYPTLRPDLHLAGVEPD